MPRIALVTWEKAPQMETDDRGLPTAFARAGAEGIPTVWSDPSVDWSSFEAAVIRNTWDYDYRTAEFFPWLERVTRATRLFNSPEVLRWNAHKAYLRELADRGAPVTPTEWIPQGGHAELRAIAEQRGWSELVVKPAVSAGARDTLRFTRERLVDAQAHADAIARRTEVMIQPYLPDLGVHGESSFIFLDGIFSHCVQRPAGMKDEPSRLPQVTAITPSAADLQRAQRCLDAVRRETVYARVDMARDERGELLLQGDRAARAAALLLGAGRRGGRARAGGALAPRLRSRQERCPSDLSVDRPVFAFRERIFRRNGARLAAPPNTKTCRSTDKLA